MLYTSCWNDFCPKWRTWDGQCRSIFVSFPKLSPVYYQRLVSCPVLTQADQDAACCDLYEFMLPVNKSLLVCGNAVRYGVQAIASCPFSIHRIYLMLMGLLSSKSAFNVFEEVLYQVRACSSVIETLWMFSSCLISGNIVVRLLLPPFPYNVAIIACYPMRNID